MLASLSINTSITLCMLVSRGLFLLGPMAASAVRFASRYCICSSSSCCIWETENIPHYYTDGNDTFLLSLSLFVKISRHLSGQGCFYVLDCSHSFQQTNDIFSAFSKCSSPIPFPKTLNHFRYSALYCLLSRKVHASNLLIKSCFYNYFCQFRMTHKYVVFLIHTIQLCYNNIIKPL